MLFVASAVAVAAVVVVFGGGSSGGGADSGGGVGSVDRRSIADVVMNIFSGVYCFSYL